MFNKINNQSPLLTKKDDAKKAENWNELAKGRATKQHGDPDNIPEGDIHAVQKIQHLAAPEVPVEKTKAALNSLEEEIRKLQTKEQQEDQQRKQIQTPPPPPTKQQSDDPMDWLDD